MDRPPGVTAKAFVLFDMLKGKMIYGFNENEKREVASLTKIITCCIALKFIEKFKIDIHKQFFSVSKKAC